MASQVPVGGGSSEIVPDSLLLGSGIFVSCSSKEGPTLDLLPSSCSARLAWGSSLGEEWPPGWSKQESCYLLCGTHTTGA